MDEDQWEAMANSYLDQCDIEDECAIEVHEAQCEPTFFYQDLLEEMKEKYAHAKLAFPGIEFDEFLDLYEARNAAKKKPGGQPKNSSVKASEPIWRAARDADRTRGYWNTLNPKQPRRRPPLLPEEIAAKRNGILDGDGEPDVDAVITAVRRPASRRWDKKQATE